EVRAGGKSLHTEQLSLTVSAASPPSAGGGGSPGGGDGVTVAPEDLFITALPNKRKTYPNEPVTIEDRVFARVNVDGDNIIHRPSGPGFWVEDLADQRPVTERAFKNGKEYVTAVIDRVALFPTSVGRKTVEPLSVEAQVAVRRTSRDPFDNFFSGIG